MSSVELSDTLYSSEDEDVILANMETKSGLPDKSASGTGRHVGAERGSVQCDTDVATVRMSSRVIRQGNLYDSSESEDEDIMKCLVENFKHKDSSERADSVISKRTKASVSPSVSSKAFKSSKSNSVISSTGSSDLTSSTLNGFSIKQCNSTDSNKSEHAHESPSSYKESRFNPFDRDIHMEEDHFDTDQPNAISSGSRLKSDSNASSSWTQPSAPASSNSDDITFADLGLTEDHYSQPEGYFGMSSTEELELAIDTCKEMILTAQKDSDKQKNLVKKLVQLRIKLQELKEGPEPLEEGVKLVVGHKFVLHSGAGSKHYCEKCNAVIWGVLQHWYRCSECGYCAHIKCLNQITRMCASVRVQEEGTYCLDICPDRGLSNQNYRCAECRAHISYKSGFSEPRVCDYSGSYYCELCHWNDTILIPARLLHNWDFDEWKVCRASKQFLKLMERKAVIRIQDVNPMLFSFVEELNEVKKLREELLIMKKYILICTVAMEMKLLLHLQSRQHFVESSDIYSIRDLIDVQRDVLLPELAQVHASWAQHIKTDCQLCRARGFVCEICKIDEILFPFDNIAVVCSDCSAVLHRHCYVKRDGSCPKCERISKRQNH